jgi:hypothetical protein
VTEAKCAAGSSWKQWDQSTTGYENVGYRCIADSPTGSEVDTSGLGGDRAVKSFTVEDCIIGLGENNCTGKVRVSTFAGRTMGMTNISLRDETPNKDGGFLMPSDYKGGAYEKYVNKRLESFNPYR